MSIIFQKSWRKMYDEKPLQNFEECGKNFLNTLWLLCGRQTTTGKRGETERQVEGYCSHHLRGDGSSDHSVLTGQADSRHQKQQ